MNKLQREVLQGLGMINEAVKEIQNSQIQNSMKKKVEFITETVTLLEKYVLNQSARNCTKTLLFQKLMMVLLDQINETVLVLRCVASNSFPVTDNFDIFELTLRRYYDQFAAMFPLRGVNLQKASHLVTDPNARKTWSKYFGKRVAHVAWDTFCEVLRNKFPSLSGNTRFFKRLRFFVNFPEDNLMTTYKWNLLIQLFGPYNSFEVNFRKYASGYGFLGLINR